ncbi:MAG: hypothetical protein PHE67_11490, partial [Campylobacterales bacterium]|nr:hypothetical protein [Campylobacterales bacterium]
MLQEVMASEIEAFIEAFRCVGNGEIAEETSRKLKECVKAVMLHEKKSTLKITLDISKIADDQIAMVGTVSAKIPEPQIKTGFFVNDRTFLP